MRVLTVLAFICSAVAGDWIDAHFAGDDAWRAVPQELVFSNESEPATLDPQRSDSVHEGRLTDALFEGLAVRDPRTLEPRPGIAARWEQSADGGSWTFHLRPGLVWSDGVALTAPDVRAAWLRLLDPALPAPYAHFLFPVRGAEAFKERRGEAAAVAVHADDALTLRVELERPCPYFLELCAFPALAPVPMHVISRHGDAWAQAGRLIGNGAFTLAAWRPRDAIVLERNARHHDAARIRLTRVVARPFDDLDAAWRAYLDGKLDWMCGAPAARVAELRRHPDYVVHPYFGTYFFRFNCSRPPFDDARVRRAFCLAVDRRQITDQVLRAGQVPTSAFVPPGMPYVPVTGLPEDGARARAELAAAGFNAQRPFPTVELLFNTSESHRAVAETLVQQWRLALGVDVRLRNSEFKVYSAEMKDLRYDLSRSGWIGDYRDPDTFLELFVTDGENNRTGWSHPPYDALLAESRAATDAAQRQALLQRLERILVEEECPVLPLYTYVSQAVVRERVRGWHENVMDFHPLRFVWLGAR